MMQMTPAALAYVATLTLAMAWAGCRSPDAPPGQDTAGERADLETILETINVGPHEVPELPLRRDFNYAYSRGDVEPFGHVTPYKEHFLEQMEYTGPGRALPEPERVDTVRIGFLGPIRPTVSVATGGSSHDETLGIAMLRGARLATEEANEAGGYRRRSIPFELVVHNDNGLWGASGNEIIQMAYTEGVWAILGTIDGANTHIAIRVALKAEVPMLTSGDTDPTLIETNIPWIVRCIGDDRQQNYILMDYLYRKMDYKRVAIIRASNRYGRFGVREIRDGSRRLGRPVVMEMLYRVGGEDLSLQLERLARSSPDAIVHWGDAADSARVLNGLRERGMQQPYFACDRSVSEEFVRLAGDNAEGVICSYPWNPRRSDPRLAAFRAAFGERFGVEPDTYAAHAYDGMNMLVWAIQHAGLNRAKIRDVLASRSQPWPGVTGDIPLSAALDDAGEVFLARREEGEWKFYSREELGIPGGTATAGVREPEPFFELRGRPLEYPGPGRDEPEPPGLQEVALGWFGPGDPTHRLAGGMWVAATLAVEEANAAGGYRGLPFRLVPAWSEEPWQNGASLLTRLAYTDRVWAIVGSTDGAATHLAEQVVAKARLPLVSPVSTDSSVNLAGVSWMFSCAPGDHLYAERLAEAWSQREGPSASFAVVRSSDHDSRRTAAEILTALGRRHRVPALVLNVHPKTRDFAPHLQALEELQPQTLFLLAGAEDSARFLRALRIRGLGLPVYGTPRMGRSAFLELAGSAAEGVRFPLLFDPSASSPRARSFCRGFEQRSGAPADYAAAYTYDAVRLAIAAVRRSGLNRARIRDAIAELSPLRGVTGVLEWDPTGQNTAGRIGVAVVRDGRVEPESGSGERE